MKMFYKLVFILPVFLLLHAIITIHCTIKGDDDIPEPLGELMVNLLCKLEMGI